MILLLFFSSHLEGPVGRIGAAVNAASNDVPPLGHLVTVQYIETVFPLASALLILKAFPLIQITSPGDNGVLSGMLSDIDGSQSRWFTW
jgi:hypothetical protein